MHEISVVGSLLPVVGIDATAGWCSLRYTLLPVGAEASLVGDGDDRVDDDRHVQRRRPLARSRPRVPAVLPPQLNDEITEAVQHLRVVVEVRRCLNVSDGPKPSLDSVETTHLFHP